MSVSHVLPLDNPRSNLQPNAMNTFIKSNSLSALLIFFSLSSASVQAADFTIDKDHSHIGFSIRHIVSKTKGELKDFSGTFSFDEKDLATLRAQFSGKTASIFTNNEKRDEHLRSGDFFDAAKYPTIDFESKKVTKISRTKLKIEGDLTLHGKTHPVTLDTEFTGKDKDPWGNVKTGFTAKTTIKRKDFGITWNKALDSGSLILGDDVEISIEIEGNEVRVETEKKP